MSHKEINKKFHEILVNRILPVLPYDNSSPSMTVYRVTRKFEGFDKEMKSSYSYPPNPERGRANIKGSPVLYTSIDPVTAVAEMKDSIKLGERFYISKWRISFDERVLAHWLVINSNTIKSKEVIGGVSNEQLEKLRKFVGNIPERFQEGFISSIEQLGDLYCSDGDDFYHITGAYSYEVLYESRNQNALIDMLVYPSVENRHVSVNIAIHPKLVNSAQMQIQEVYEVSIKENTLRTMDNGHVRMNIHKRGVFEKDVVCKWQTPAFVIENVDFEGLELYTYNEVLLKGKEASLKKINGGQTTVQDWLNEAIKSDEIKNEAFKTIELNEFKSLNKNWTFSQELQLITELNHGYKIETVHGRSCIHRVKLPLTVQMTYK